MATTTRMADFLKRNRGRGSWFHPSERYYVDFADDFNSQGWVQFDTNQDAHYFGVWCNSRERVILTYCEGDWSLEELADDAAYNAAIGRLCDFYEPGRVASVVSSEGVVEVQQDRQAFLIGSNVELVGIGDVLKAVLR